MEQDYVYNFVLSFAGEDRKIVEQVKRVLEQNHFRIFYDLDEQDLLLGKDLAEYLSKLYQEDGEYCIMFISKYYIRKPWTKWERRAALAKALRSRKEYIIPYFLDNSKLASIPESIGRAKFPDTSPEEFAALLTKKYYKESQSLEIMDGIFIKNVDAGKTLTLFRKNYSGDELYKHFVDYFSEESYRYERGVNFNFSISNITDQTIHLSSYLKTPDFHAWGWRYGPFLMILDKLCRPTAKLSGVDMEAHAVRNLGYKICSFYWKKLKVWDRKKCMEKKTIFFLEKKGPPKVLSIFPGGVKDYPPDAMEEVLKSLARNNFEIFNGVKFEIGIEFAFEEKYNTACVETIIYGNRAQFMKTWIGPWRRF